MNLYCAVIFALIIACGVKKYFLAKFDVKLLREKRCESVLLYTDKDLHVAE